MSKRIASWLLVVAFTFITSCAHGDVKKDVPYVPTPETVVEEMLKMVDIKATDRMYDLGCGDGRIVITAAKQYGAKGTGVDIDPERIKESNENAQKAGVTDKVKFVMGNLFEMDFKDANVLTLYLLPSVNLKLRPKILDLKPGTRIVSHAFDMDDWQPDKQTIVMPGGQSVYFWIVPAKVDGSWKAKLSDQSEPVSIQLKQNFQEVSGTAKVGAKQYTLKDAKLSGPQLTFTLAANQNDAGTRYTCRVDGKTMMGSAKADGAAKSVDLVAEKE